MAGKRAMTASSKRRVLLVDHPKFDGVTLHHLAPPRNFDLMVVDAGIDDATSRELDGCSVPFEIVPL